MSRLLAIGDIHGCHHALMTLLDAVQPTADDQLITLGDYVDRGPASAAVLDWVIDQSRQGRCIPLRGNHEIMMLDALQRRTWMVPWLHFGGRETLESYSERNSPDSVSGVPIGHLNFLTNQLLPYFETEHHLFVHATLLPELPLNQQPDDALYWRRFEEITPHSSSKTVICGHTAQHSGLPADCGFAICIDTYAYGGEWLTCLDVDSRHYWQANEQGETREEDLRQA